MTGTMSPAGAQDSRSVALDVFTNPDNSHLAELLHQALAEATLDAGLDGAGHDWLLRVRIDPRERPSLIVGSQQNLVVTYALLPIADSLDTITDLMLLNSREIAPDIDSLEAVAHLIVAEMKVHLVELEVEAERAKERTQKPA